MTQQRALPNIKALTFDVFGTVVDWRSSITAALQSACPDAAAADPSWAPTFAAQWRRAYATFTRSFNPVTTPWKDIDTHHHESLLSLLDQHALAGSVPDTLALSRAWHRLTPWPDAAAGLRALRAGGLVTATLSNGNTALLRDLDAFGGLGFDVLLSAEDFGCYKPNPRTYLGAVERLGMEGPAEVAMVAAHLGDLKAARALGMRTVYVEREGEEEWDDEGIEEAKVWVDVWIGLGEGGFVELAKRLGRTGDDDGDGGAL